MKTTVKKLTTLLLAVIMTLSLAACGSDGGSAATSSTVDVDLTEMSSTMIYSEVSNMMMAPDDYVGKTVKMSGQFASFYDESIDEYYYACIIADATACCQQGMEFQLAGNHKYPDDYPEENAEITVQGTFSIYEQDGQSYVALKDATFI